VIQKGDRVTAKVIKLDSEHKKIALSIKEYLIDKNNVNRDDIVVGAQQEPAPKKKRAVKKKQAEEQPAESQE